MSEEEENNTGSIPQNPPPPPPPSPPRAPAAPRKVLGIFPATADAHLWRHKWSTWLGAIAAGCVAAVGFYALAPDRMQASVPEWVLAVVMGLGMACGFGVAVATSIQQKAPQS